MTQDISAVHEQRTFRQLKNWSLKQAIIYKTENSLFSTELETKIS